VRVGIIGTSWWVDAMYLPALDGFADVHVVALAGRDPDTARRRAEDWDVPASYDDWRAMLHGERLDGLIVAAANPVHYPATKLALECDLDVLCEKPVADTYGEAVELAALAQERSAVTMVPFTYAFMPGFRYLSRLVAAGSVGDLHHVGLRYHTGYAASDDTTGYSWKLDARRNPSGALGDIGSHFVYLALQLGGDVTAVTARLDTVGRHAPTDPGGAAYPVAPDTAAVVMEFANGAQGLLHASTVAYEGTSMDQRHVIEVHGSGGTLRYLVDWDDIQAVHGARIGEGPPRELPIPDDIWGDVRRGRVHDTYRDVFRTTDAMARGWARALGSGQRVRPDLSDGASVQRIIDACLRSSREARRVTVVSVEG
jgi:predicted dehydrogenase